MAKSAPPDERARADASNNRNVLGFLLNPVTVALGKGRQKLLRSIRHPQHRPRLKKYFSRSQCNFLFPPPFFAKVKQHKSPANRAKIGGRVHFDFPKKNRVKCTVRLEPDSFSGRIQAWYIEIVHADVKVRAARPLQ